MNSSSTSKKTDASIQLTRTFRTDMATLFAYLTQPEHLTMWFAPSDELETEVHLLELREGGHYRISMIDKKNDKRFTVAGTYQKILPPTKLIFSWRWETEPELEESRVSIQLSETPEGTVMELCHDQFETTVSRDDHEQGWMGCLTRLENAVNH